MSKTELTLFELIKFQCKTHPRDVIYDRNLPQYSVYYENYTDDAYYDTLRELVEDQGCNWEWYCDYFSLNMKDEKWGKW